MTRAKLSTGLLALGLLLFSDPVAATGPWRVPGSFCQVMGGGYGAGHHAPIGDGLSCGRPFAGEQFGSCQPCAPAASSCWDSSCGVAVPERRVPAHGVPMPSVAYPHRAIGPYGPIPFHSAAPQPTVATPSLLFAPPPSPTEKSPTEKLPEPASSSDTSGE